MLAVAFLPFPTKLPAEYIREDTSERAATTLYGLSLLVTTALLSLLWRYAVRHRLVRDDAKESDVQVLTRRLSPGLVAYVVLILLGLFVPVAAVMGYLAIALYYLVPLARALRQAAPVGRCHRPVTGAAAGERAVDTGSAPGPPPRSAPPSPDRAARTPGTPPPSADQFDVVPEGGTVP